MTFSMRVTNLDRLTVDWRSYRLTDKNDVGYMFDSTGSTDSTVFYTFDEFRELLKRPDVLLERDYFLPESHEIRNSVNVDALGGLKEGGGDVVWRHAYVDGYLQFQKARKVNRTELSVELCLPEIEALVNKQAAAAQGGWVGRRAGQKKLYRDPPCARTLLEWVRRFERSGNSVLGLVPRTHNSGNRSPRFSLEEVRIIGQCIGDYLTRHRRSKRIVAESCVTHFKHLNETRAKEGLPQLSVPSQRKVEREITKLDPYSTYAHRHGVEAANRKFMLYEDGIEASYPMERIEIDEWQVDLISLLAERGALDGLSREQLEMLPRGRRWLYLAIDCATRCVVGMRLAVTPNSENAIALLADVTRDKTDLALAAGCESTWEHGGGLKTVATDLGAAFVDDAFRIAIFDAHGTPETPTGGLPQLRPRVERIFGTFGSNLMPELAGRTFSNPKERGDYPSEEMASITDDALMQMLTLYVVDAYHNRKHRGLNGETPNNRWKRLAAEKGVVPDVPERVRRRAFGKFLRRTVSGKGVRVFGIDFQCDALRQFHLHRHSRDVELRIDLTDIGWIMVRVGEEWFPASALQKCFDGVSYDDWEATARQLRLKYREEAAVHERVVAEALQKIIAINAAEQKTVGAILKAVTPAGLARAKEDLFLGLSIAPDDPEGFDLPPEPDLFGSRVPLLPDHHDSGEAKPSNEVEPDDQDDAKNTSKWRFDDE